MRQRVGDLIGYPKAEAYVRHEAGVFQGVRVPYGQSQTSSPLSDAASIKEEV
jgi:hypothetical protein